MHIKRNTFYILIGISIALLFYVSLTGKKVLLGENNAREILKIALSEPNNAIATGNVFDSISFVHAIEPQLNKDYGKENINKEKPYEIYHFDRYWVATGTLPEAAVGGTFDIVLDTKESRIIYSMHSK